VKTQFSRLFNIHEILAMKLALARQMILQFDLSDLRCGGNDTAVGMFWIRKTNRLQKSLSIGYWRSLE